MLEFQLTADSTRAISVWVTILLVVSFVLCLVYLSQFLSQRFALNEKFDRLCRLLVATLAFCVIFIWQLYCYCPTHDTVSVWCFGTALAGGAVVSRFSASLSLFQPRLKRFATIALAALSVAEFASFAEASKRFGAATETFEFYEPGILKSKPEVIATTDDGTLIDLGERQVSDEDFQEYVTKTSRHVNQLAQKAMLRARPKIDSNCHGWVFARGEHIVRGENVETILNDNDYRNVFEPEPNDVVLYRSENGVVLHTGLVRGQITGEIIVESKWGLGAVYMHVAEEQPYSQFISYWRTERGTHDLRIKSSTDVSMDTSTKLTGM